MTAEFERQVETLIERGYPEVAQESAAEFRKRVGPLREHLAEVVEADANVPFVLVIQCELMPAHEAIMRVERRGRTGFAVLDAAELTTFEPIETVSLPGGPAYLLTGVDAGGDMLNVTPRAALQIIESRQRSPLTIDEGIALITHHPELVAKGGGFSLLGSRCGDRRVTALWISEGRPKLGWCWAGNPHTWLGSASCARRIGA